MIECVFCVDAFLLLEGLQYFFIVRTINVELITFDVEWTINRDYLGGKTAARFNTFLEFYFFKKFHPVHEQILNGCLRRMTAINSLGKRYIMNTTSANTEFKARFSWCFEGTGAVLLGTLCFFVFFFFCLFLLFVWPLQKQKAEKRLREVLKGTPVYILYYAICSPRLNVKSKAHDVKWVIFGSGRGEWLSHSGVKIDIMATLC